MWDVLGAQARPDVYSPVDLVVRVIGAPVVRIRRSRSEVVRLREKIQESGLLLYLGRI